MSPPYANFSGNLAKTPLVVMEPINPSKTRNSSMCNKVLVAILSAALQL